MKIIEISHDNFDMDDIEGLIDLIIEAAKVKDKGAEILSLLYCKAGELTLRNTKNPLQVAEVFTETIRKAVQDMNDVKCNVTPIHKGKSYDA